MTSIRRYLVTVLIALLTLTSFLAALQSYRQSISQSTILFDADLQALAASLLSQYEQRPPEMPMRIAMQVWHNDELYYRSNNAPEYKIPKSDGYSEQNFSGQRWRTFSQTTPEGLTVMVAQPLSQRLELADNVVLSSLYPVVLSIPLQALLIWLVVSKGLSPLLRLKEQLEKKKADDLSPVILDSPPQELQRVLFTTNQLLSKLENAFIREKRFASDVAHELRTPLSVLQVNLHNAQQQWQKMAFSDEQGVMQALQDGVSRMTALIEQIMLLNRTNPEHFKAKLQPICLPILCRNVIAELYPEFERKSQNIAMEAEDDIMLRADEFAIRQLLINLLGNASKYMSDGDIVVSVHAIPGFVQLIVEDSGPGIAPDQYHLVFERFYRVGGDRHASGQPGNGLGMAIVQDIVTLHNGRISLAVSRFASGLKVIVELPA